MTMNALSPSDRFAKRCGVTLIELLCVIGIVGVLAAIYLAAISGAFGRSVKVLREIFGMD